MTYPMQLFFLYLYIRTKLTCTFQIANYYFNLQGVTESIEGCSLESFCELCDENGK
jgi:hypothetical protein